MQNLSLRERQRDYTERLRGWIIYILFMQKPKGLELAQLVRLLDRHNFPVSRRRLSEELDYLSSAPHRLLRVFPLGAVTPIDEVEQAKLIERYCDSESDADMGLSLTARITAAGVNYQEGRAEYAGIHRVE